MVRHVLLWRIIQFICKTDKLFGTFNLPGVLLQQRRLICYERWKCLVWKVFPKLCEKTFSPSAWWSTRSWPLTRTRPSPSRTCRSTRPGLKRDKLMRFIENAKSNYNIMQEILNWDKPKVFCATNEQRKKVFFLIFWNSRRTKT